MQADCAARGQRNLCPGVRRRPPDSRMRCLSQSSHSLWTMCARPVALLASGSARLCVPKGEPSGPCPGLADIADLADMPRARA